MVNDNKKEIRTEGKLGDNKKNKTDGIYKLPSQLIFLREKGDICKIRDKLETLTEYLLICQSLF